MNGLFDRCVWLLAEAAAGTPAADPAAADSAGSGASPLMLLIVIFTMAVFVGVEIIVKIPPTLHTPLMSGSNAISGITVIGALLALEAKLPGWAQALGCVAIVLAMMNVVGGFLVTHRMLGMFRRK